jgi:protein SCO1
MKAIRFALWGMVAVFAAILGYLFWQSSTGTQVGTVQLGGPFSLAAARDGGRVESASLVGKPYGVFFGFTHCPEVCPTSLLDMTSAYEKLSESGKDFRLFFITVDPARDTATFLKDYLENFDARIEGLVPTEEELRKVAGDFRAIYEKVPTSDGSYTMNHTASIFLFDRTGKFAGTIAYGEAEEMRLGKLRRLLAQ